MRSATFAFTALASIAAASAESIYFSAKSDDNSISGPISSIHEGAGINYFLVAQGGSGQVFDLENGAATSPQGPFTANVGVSGPYLAAGPAVSPLALTFHGDALDTNNFWACKNTNDPYNYSAQSSIIAVTDKGNNTAPFASCTPVVISKNTVASSSSAAASSVAASAAPVSSAASHYSHASHASHASSAAGWSNATVITTDVTVTGYTTYCPESTVLTVTTCSAQKCAPSVITVTQATTVTVTGECVVPSTLTTVAPVATTSKAAPASSSIVTKTSAASSAAPSSTAAVTSLHAGAGKAAVGVAGIAGVIAMLI